MGLPGAELPAAIGGGGGGGGSMRSLPGFLGGKSKYVRMDDVLPQEQGEDGGGGVRVRRSRSSRRCWCDERLHSVHPERPAHHRGAARSARRVPQLHLPLRQPRRWKDLRRLRPEMDDWPRRHRLSGRRGCDDVRSVVPCPHDRQAAGRRRHRVRRDDRAGVHRRDLPRRVPGLLHVLPGDLHQPRHPPRIHLQLRLLWPPRPYQLACHARRRHPPVRLHCLCAARDPGVAEVAGHAEQDGRGASGASQGHRQRRRGQGEACRDRGRRRRHERRQVRRQDGVAGADETVSGDPADARHRTRHPVLPANHRHRRAGLLQPDDIPERRDHHGEPAPRRHGRRRVLQDGVHRARHRADRPRGAEAAAVHQHGRHDRLPRRPRGDALDARARVGVQERRHRRRHPDGVRRRRLLLGRDRAHLLGDELGDLPAAAALAGGGAWRGDEQSDQRRCGHVFSVRLPRHLGLGRLLRLRRRIRPVRRVRAPLRAGDERKDSGRDRAPVWRRRPDAGRGGAR